MNKLMTIGAILFVLGMLGLFVPYFTTNSTKDVIALGDMKLQSTESTTHVIPPLLAAGVLVAGLVMLGAGVFRKN
jgi:hypothetical protein